MPHSFRTLNFNYLSTQTDTIGSVERCIMSTRLPQLTDPQWVHNVTVRYDGGCLVVRMLVGDKNAPMKAWKVVRHVLPSEYRSRTGYMHRCLVGIVKTLSRLDIDIRYYRLYEAIGISVLQGLFQDYEWKEEFKIVDRVSLHNFLSWMVK